jgi:serine/threonine-protein phosphatase 5
MAEVSEENKAAASALKAKANEAFKSLSHPLIAGPETDLMSLIGKNFMEAATLYGQALEKNDQDATIWCNRAFARMNLVTIDSYHMMSTASLTICPGRVRLRSHGRHRGHCP